MEPICVSAIVSAVNGRLLFGGADPEVSSVSTNSREIEPGALFVPVIGEKVDGHQFIPMAFEAGAAACFTQEHGKEYCPPQAAVILVEDTVKALQDFAAWYRGRYDIPVIGVTGSVGKSSTKEMIAAALSKGKLVHKTAGNFNSQIGLPLTVFGMEKQFNAAVIEMGMSNFGEMEKLSKIARPTSAVITKIGISHIEQLGSQENIRAEKLHIADTVGKDGAVYLNGDDPLLYELNGALRQRTVLFGIGEECDYRAVNIGTVKEYTRFLLQSPMGEFPVMIPALGVHNVLNALAAIAVATDMGLKMDTIREGLLTYEGLAMRQQIHYLEGLTVIDDSYNASPDSIKSGIGVLNQIPVEGKRIAVLADMLELGERSHKSHYDLGVYAAQNGVDAIVAIGREAAHIADGALSVKPNYKAFRCADNEEAYKTLKSLLETGDGVLVKGSRGMHADEIVKGLLDGLTME